MTKTFIYLALLGTGSISSLVHGAEHLVIVERLTGETTIDLGVKGDSPGDLLSISNVIFDSANKLQIGTDQGFCVRTIPAKSWHCSITVLLKDGHIATEGVATDQGDSEVAITGGTGIYVGAKGVMKMHPRDQSLTSYDFILDLR